MSFPIRCALVAAALTLLVPAPAAIAASAAEAKRPRVALVLSGGGARGLAHVGVLQVLEQLKVPVDCVVGTSMGALVGGAFAAGVGPARMQEIVGATDLGALFDDLPPRAEIPERMKRDDYRPLFDFTLGYNDGKVQLPAGASAGYKFELFLKHLVGPGASVALLDFDALPTPYRAVATNLETGEMHVFSKGDLPRVMRASMSLPAIIAPVEIEGRVYVDGGLVRNLPVDIGRELCGELVIAVNLGTPLKTRDQIRSVIDVAGQSINLLTEQNVRRSLGELTPRDVLIEPDLAGFGSADFDAKAEIIARGVKAATAKSGELSRLAVGGEAYAAWAAQRGARELAAPPIRDVEVVASEGFNAEAVERDLSVKAGKDFKASDLEADLARMYGRGDYSYVGYSVVPVDGGATVLIEADAKPWGPGYLKFGLGAASDLDSPAQLNLAASYRRTWLNELGAEFRADAQLGYDSFLRGELMQPLQVRDGAFVAPYASIRRNFIQFYREELRLGQFRINSARGGLDVGFEGRTGELRIGPYVGRIETTPDFGVVTPVVPEAEVTQVGFELKGIVDQLDRFVFPRSGVLASLNVRGTYADWGSDDQYTRGQLTLRGVTSFGEHTLSASLEAGGELDGDIPYYDPFVLGGPLRLSGLFLDQLTGSRYNLASLGYYRQYARLPPQLGRGLYIGASLEGGRINDRLMKDPWDWVTAGAVYWGADTILGPIFVGYGYSSLGQGTVYLVVGPRF